VQQVLFVIALANAVELAILDRLDEDRLGQVDGMQVARARL
jgi:hypothetical protein